jgi:probable rRNA maturation factor
MIHFNYQVPLSALRNKTELKQFLVLLCKMEHKTIGEINFVFCSDDYLLSLNQQFLKHDTYTDIISFDYTVKGGALKGEIYISIDRVKENASLFGSSFVYEIHRVIFHGVLHLCGYKDKLKGDQTVMRAKEEFYLRKYLS